MTNTFWIVLLSLPYIGLSVVGGKCAVTRLCTGYSNSRLFRADGACLYLTSFIASSWLAMYAYHQFKGDWADWFFLVVFIPGHAAWATFAFIAGIARVLGPMHLPVAPTFDQGDALMARKQFAAAETQYRSDFARDPLCVEALLRIINALLSQEKYDEALSELSAAHQHCIDRTDDPKMGKITRQERLLKLTYALGDLYVGRLGDNEKARQLYRLTLEILFGYVPANPLRNRLKALEAKGVMSIQDAAMKAQPEKISL